MTNKNDKLGSGNKGDMLGGTSTVNDKDVKTMVTTTEVKEDVIEDTTPVVEDANNDKENNTEETVE